MTLKWYLHVCNKINSIWRQKVLNKKGSCKNNGSILVLKNLFEKNSFNHGRQQCNIIKSFFHLTRFFFSKYISTCKCGTILKISGVCNCKYVFMSMSKWPENPLKFWLCKYSRVPNISAGLNKRAGGKIGQKLIAVQAQINVQVLNRKWFFLHVLVVQVGKNPQS